MRKNENDLLTKIQVAIARLETKVEECFKQNEKEHQGISEKIDNLSKAANEELHEQGQRIGELERGQDIDLRLSKSVRIKELEERLRKIEETRVQLSTGVKIALFLIGAIPTIIAILEHFHII